MEFIILGREKRERDKIDKMIYAINLDQQMLPNFNNNKFAVSFERFTLGWRS